MQGNGRRAMLYVRHGCRFVRRQSVQDPDIVEQPYRGGPAEDDQLIGGFHVRSHGSVSGRGTFPVGEHMQVFGYESEGRIVGRIEGLSKGCRPFAVIENVVVHESMRRRGIGTRLVCRAINQAEMWHCYKVVVETGTRNEGKLLFYERCGLVRGDKTAFIRRFE